MKTILAGLALASASALGLASHAAAAPMAPITTSTAFHGHHHGGWGGGFGVGFSTGGGYSPTYVQQSGYYATEYRWVPTTVLTGYDMYGRPIYGTQYVQQAFQVWVPTAQYYAPSYSRPSVSFGFGYRWR